MKLVLDQLKLPRANQRVLHFAPEKGLAQYLQKTVGNGYTAADFDPERYPYVDTQKIDLVTEAELLPSNHYDLILHSHVLEHVPCGLAPVLFHFHRALKPTGRHIFCIPFSSGNYEECFDKMTDKEAIRRFGQFDHVRKFGLKDVDQNLGKILHLDTAYSLYDYHSREELDAVNIPERDRAGLHGSTIFVVSKNDYKLSFDRT